MTNELTQPYLIVGGTGRTGRRVAQQLTVQGAAVRITSRRGPVPFDWQDDATWNAQLRGIRRAYVAFHPDIAVPGAAECLGRFAARASDLGVQRIVLLSGRDEAAARDAESEVAARVGECTVLRSAFFMQDFSEHFLLDAVRSGLIAMPAGDTPEPFVDIDDLAAVAIHALLRDDLVGRTLELTGPELLTFTEAASALSTTTGGSVEYRSCTAAEFAAGAEADGVPPSEARMMAELFAQVLDGRNAHLTDDLPWVLGRPARHFAEYARLAAADGIWTSGTATHRD